MAGRRVNFCETFVPEPEAIWSYLKSSVESGQLSNFGPLYQALCLRLSEIWNLGPDKEVIVCSSGHVALMAAYACLGIKRLLVPAYTFESTRVAATLQGISIDIIDVEQRTGVPDPKLVELLAGADCDGVCLVTPLSAIPALGQFQEICHQKSIRLVIDGAASFGSPGIGVAGDVYCLSFHATKSLPVGEGGAVIADRETAVLIRNYLNFGFNEDRVPVGPGLNGKASEYTCAIALALLDEISPRLKVRRENGALLRSLLNDYHHTLLSEAGAETVYQSYPVYADSPEKALTTIRRLGEVGIEARQYYKPLQPLPISYRLYKTNICLPVHPSVGEEDLHLMAKIVKESAW